LGGNTSGDVWGAGSKTKTCIAAVAASAGILWVANKLVYWRSFLNVFIWKRPWILVFFVLSSPNLRVQN
jgi:hypothetical protein